MTELEKQIAVARLYGYDIDGETATYKDMDASISGSCHVSELDMCDHSILWQIIEILLDDGKIESISIYNHEVYIYFDKYVNGMCFIVYEDADETHIDILFNALAEASKYILE